MTIAKYYAKYPGFKTIFKILYKSKELTYSKIPIILPGVVLSVTGIKKKKKKLKTYDIEYMQVLYCGFYFSNYFCHILSSEL